MKIYEQKLIGAKSDPQTQQNGIRAITNKYNIPIIIDKNNKKLTSKNPKKEKKTITKLQELYKEYKTTKKDKLINKMSKLEYKYILQLKIKHKI